MFFRNFNRPFNPYYTIQLNFNIKCSTNIKAAAVPACANFSSARKKRGISLRVKSGLGLVRRPCEIDNPLSVGRMSAALGLFPTGWYMALVYTLVRGSFQLAAQLTHIVLERAFRI